MTRFMFWNLNGKRLEDVVSRLTANYQVDVLILAESREEPGALAGALTLASDTRYWYCPGTCQLVQVYASFPPMNVAAIRESERYTIRRVSLPSRVEVLLVAVHLRSKVWGKDSSQLLDCHDLADEVRRAEAQVTHKRTILVGDLNMNPFEEGVAAARALNAVMSAEIASTGSRTVAGRAYPFFYNPMWGKMGDAGGTPAGTYFFRDSNDVCYYWNMLDQVLVRPELLPHFDPKSVRVLDGDGEESLLRRRGRFRQPTPSDHLPLLFDLSL